MNAGEALLDLARAGGRTSLFVVGTGKNAGKTVAMRAIANAAVRRGLKVGLTSAGRDGEMFDAVDSLAKPRLFLETGTIVATARALLPRVDYEVLEETQWQTAAGPVVFARAGTPAFYELAGPPRASELRRCVQRLYEFGCEQVIVDGAVDRVAALAGGGDSVVISVGADAGSTIEEAAENARALVERLCMPAYDPSQPFEKIEGALTAAQSATLSKGDSQRQVVVRDPTRVVVAGKDYLRLAESVRLRCEHPLHVVAVTVAALGRERDFEPRAFRDAVAWQTGLPVFDVYAGAVSEGDPSKALS
jgi:hypothetical protein